jgi:hypothetical protein
MQILLPRFGGCGNRIASPLQMRSRIIDVTVRVEKALDSAGAISGRKLVLLHSVEIGSGCFSVTSNTVLLGIFCGQPGGTGVPSPGAV